MIRLILLILLVAIGFYGAWPAYTGYSIYQALESNDPTTLAAKVDFPSVRRSMRGPVLAQVNSRIDTVMRDLGPATGLVGSQIPRGNIEKIIDGALARVVEPKRIAEIYATGGDLNAALQEAVLNEIDEMGGLMVVLNLGKLIEQGGGAPGGEGGSVGGIKLPGGLGKLLQDKEVSKALGGIAGKIGLDPDKLAGKLFPARAGKADPARASDGKPSVGLGNVKSFGFASATAMQVGLARSPDAAGPEVTAEMAFRNYDWRVTKLIPNLLER